jgi:hypothetical protein
MSLVQSGWLQYTQTGSGNLNGLVNGYRLLVSESQNQQVARDGTVRGASVVLQNLSTLSKIYFAVLRHVTGLQYTLVGKSEEITISAGADGTYTYTFTQPIKNCRSTDAFCIGYKTTSNAANVLKAFNGTTDAAYYPIQDQATTLLRWIGDGAASADYASLPSTITLDSGGSSFTLICMCPLMDPAVIQAAAVDSVGEGSPIFNTWRRNSTAKDRLGAFALRLGRDFLGVGVEISGNVTGSDNTSEAYTSSLTSSVWNRSPRVLLLHTGVNDIGDFCSAAAQWYGTPPAIPGSPTSAEINAAWTSYAAQLGLINAACNSNHCTLVLTDIFPWTGNTSNTSGNHLQHTIADLWNANLAAWAATNGVRLLSARTALGQQRTVAKSGDPTPTASNLWDLQTAYMYTGDGLGVHLTEAGCTAAAQALAAQLGTITYRGTNTGLDLYAVFYDSLGRVWYRNGWEEMNVSHWPDYVWPMGETPESSYRYVTLFPPGIQTAGTYRVEVYQRGAAVPAIGDTFLESRPFGWLGASLPVPVRTDASGNAYAVDTGGVWDIADGIEVGVTPKQALQRIGAVVAGKVSGAGSGVESFTGLDGATPRVVVTTSPGGNRLSVTYDPS